MIHTQTHCGLQLQLPCKYDRRTLTQKLTWKLLNTSITYMAWLCSSSFSNNWSLPRRFLQKKAPRVTVAYCTGPKVPKKTKVGGELSNLGIFFRYYLFSQMNAGGPCRSSWYKNQNPFHTMDKSNIRSFLSLNFDFIEISVMLSWLCTLIFSQQLWSQARSFPCLTGTRLFRSLSITEAHRVTVVAKSFFWIKWK
jgi:hypothetical protein